MRRVTSGPRQHVKGNTIAPDWLANEVNAPIRTDRQRYVRRRASTHPGPISTDRRKRGVVRQLKRPSDRMRRALEECGMPEQLDRLLHRALRQRAANARG